MRAQLYNNRQLYKRTYSTLLLLSILSFLSCKAQPVLQHIRNNNSLQFNGRIKINDSSAIMYWPGSNMSMSFEGTKVSVVLKDEKGENYYYSIIDDSVIETIKPDTTIKIYNIAQNLKNGKHKVQLFKLTEETAGKTWFYGFETNGRALKTPKRAERKIQFYGNSITAGYSVDDTAGDSRATQYFNNYYTYAALTARHYDAAYFNVSKSGIGLMLSWFPVIMPELYDRLDPNDSTSKWDFSNDNTNVVVVDLMQNDSWLVNKHDHAQFKARFGTTPPDSAYIVNSYKKFIQTLRSKHPTAAIICTLGSMDATKSGSPWPGYVQQATDELNDPKILTYFFAYKQSAGHPKRKDHQIMANDLIKFIDANITW